MTDDNTGTTGARHLVKLSMTLDSREPDLKEETLGGGEEGGTE